MYVSLAFLAALFIIALIILIGLKNGRNVWKMIMTYWAVLALKIIWEAIEKIGGTPQ